jgi:23S rRNA pseudouridine2457 synthase
LNHYFIIHKPFQVLSQFTADGGKQCLKDYFDVPNDVYPVGRLDYDSEGLLLLTNDKRMNYALLHPTQQHARTYWAQVEGIPSLDAIKKIQSGVQLNIDGKIFLTAACKAKLLNPDPMVAERNPPIRFRANIPTSWLQLTLTEGKNRQVRRMTAAIGHPTLRLIRYSIGNCTLDGLAPGEMRAISELQCRNLFLK